MVNNFKYSPVNRRKQAIRDLAGSPCSFDIEGDKIIKWREPEGGQPSDADVEAKVVEYEALWNAQEYARNRTTEYPAITEQLDEIYHNGIDSWKAVIKVTKDKYPKG